jgi:hypothetical protein
MGPKIFDRKVCIPAHAVCIGGTSVTRDSRDDVAGLGGIRKLVHAIAVVIARLREYCISD